MNVRATSHATHHPILLWRTSGTLITSALPAPHCTHYVRLCGVTGMACLWHAMIWMVLPVPHIACVVIETCSLRELVTKSPKSDSAS